MTLQIQLCDILADEVTVTRAAVNKIAGKVSEAVRSEDGGAALTSRCIAAAFLSEKKRRK